MFFINLSFVASTVSAYALTKKTWLEKNLCQVLLILGVLPNPICVVFNLSFLLSMLSYQLEQI